MHEQLAVVLPLDVNHFPSRVRLDEFEVYAERLLPQLDRDLRRHERPLDQLLADEQRFVVLDLRKCFQPRQRQLERRHQDV